MEIDYYMEVVRFHDTRGREITAPLGQIVLVRDDISMPTVLIGGVSTEVSEATGSDIAAALFEEKGTE